MDRPACAYHARDVAGSAVCVGLALPAGGSRVRATRVGTEVCGPDMTEVTAGLSWLWARTASDETLKSTVKLDRLSCLYSYYIGDKRNVNYRCVTLKCMT